jgi:hypothetical protein
MQGQVRDLAIVRMKIEVVKLGHNFHSPVILSTRILRVVQIYYIMIQTSIFSPLSIRWWWMAVARAL